MAKKKKYKRKSSKCPEPFNTLIDIAAGVTMGAVADHMEKKYHYSAKGKINPYAVSAMGLASGRMKSTEDVLRTGAFLGAMGSFDVEADVPSSHSYIPEDPVFRQIRETKINDNRYAWRLNCEDGDAYGVSPYNYETRAAYNEALKAAKAGIEDVVETQEPETASAAVVDDGRQYIYCRVSRLDSGANEYYLSATNDIKVGDTVHVPTGAGTASGIVIAVELHTAANAPQPPETMQWIERRKVLNEDS